MLNTLLVHGYVLQDPITQQYALSLRFSRLGVLVRQQTDLLQLARPFLRELADRCRDTVCLIAPDGDDALCVETAPGPDGLLLVHQQVGARVPLHTSAAGKLLLLNFSNQQLNEYLDRRGQTAVTPAPSPGGRPCWRSWSAPAPGATAWSMRSGSWGPGRCPPRCGTSPGRSRRG